MAILDKQRLRKHFQAAKANNGIGTEQPTDVRDTIEKGLDSFIKGVYETRQGIAQDDKGNRIAAYDVSLDEAVAAEFGGDLQQFYRGLGIYTGSDSMLSVGKRFGIDNLNVATFVQMLVDSSTFAANAPTNTTGISTDFRFILPELVLNAVRLGAEIGAQNPNWYQTTQTMTMRKATMPQIQRGNAGIRRINEGADLPTGTLRFGKKEVETYKVGTGFVITDELMFEATLDMLFLFMQEVGFDMAIGTDVAAIDTLINGDQLDGSESAPVVGVADTSKGFQFIDLQKVFTRMQRLGIPANRIIAGEDDGIGITNIDKFQGFQGAQKLASIASILGVPNVFNLDTFPLPADQILFLNPTRALARLKYRGLLVEKRRNPSNQTDELYVSDHIGFSIIKRDARLLLDRSVTIQEAPFPPYMDIDARITGFQA